MAQFSNAKIGDKVWSTQHGWGKVHSLYINQISPCCKKLISGATFPLSVVFKNGYSASFTLNGELEEYYINPTLFWDEIRIVAPKKPDYCKCGKKLENGWYPQCYDCVRSEKPKEECEACHHIKEHCYGEATVFLLNQHHDPDCPKGKDK